MTAHASRAVAAALALALAACGQKGPLYLPDTTRGEIVTRPTQSTAPAGTGAENSPASPDTPPQSASPAPEVTAPQPVEDKDSKKTGVPPPK